MLMQALELRRKFFIRINYTRHLTDGLVGSAGVQTDRSPLKSRSWAFVFSDMNVYVGEGTSVASMFCLWIADALVKFWLSTPKKPAQEANTHGNNSQTQLLQFCTSSYKHTRPRLLAAPTYSSCCSIPRSLHGQIGLFSMSRQPNFYVGSRISLHRQRLGNLFYLRGIG